MKTHLNKFILGQDERASLQTILRHLLLICAAIALPVQAAPTECGQIAKVNFATLNEAPTQIRSAKLIPATGDLPEFCEVRGYVSPQVRFAVRLPATDWNEKLLFQGCGGFCGDVFIERADDALKRGYATTTTDMGHNSSALDGKWAYNNRELEVDFAWRATHVTTIAAKAIVNSFYGRAGKLNYYRGCSTGGRQGLVEAQRFPEDFDGVIVGAPVIHYGRGAGLQLLWSVLSTLDSEGRSLFSQDDIRFLADRVLNECDDIDGVSDGIIAVPRNCSFKPSSLRCKDGNVNGCFSPEQVSAIERIYRGPTKSNGDTLFYGGLEYGSELNWIGTYVGKDGRPGFYLDFIGDLFRYIVLENDPGPHWDPKTFDFDRDTPLLDAMEPLFSGTNPDLRRFKANGGKIIQYHGWNDHSVIPAISLDYNELVTRTMGGEEATQSFYRLFMVPGMNHCRGGPGAHDIDYLSALENWRERGEAPKKLVGTGTREDGSTFTRPVFAHPLQTQYQDGSFKAIRPEK